MNFTFKIVILTEHYWKRKSTSQNLCIILLIHAVNKLIINSNNNAIREIWEFICIYVSTYFYDYLRKTVNKK